MSTYPHAAAAGAYPIRLRHEIIEKKKIHTVHTCTETRTFDLNLTLAVFEVHPLPPATGGSMECSPTSILLPSAMHKRMFNEECGSVRFLGLQYSCTPNTGVFLFDIHIQKGPLTLDKKNLNPHEKIIAVGGGGGSDPKRRV